MVLGHAALKNGINALSVLALSSRFDGRWLFHVPTPVSVSFQYSLCRVVLMVGNKVKWMTKKRNLSVLALSSRFDGPAQKAINAVEDATFSTRSVESF